MFEWGCWQAVGDGRKVYPGLLEGNATWNNLEEASSIFTSHRHGFSG
jgi:hypothetical protein